MTSWSKLSPLRIIMSDQETAVPAEQTPAIPPAVHPDGAPDELTELYTRWQSEPTGSNLHAVVKGLQPTIDYTLSQYGARGDALIEGEARLVAARAVRKYDPAYGASLRTHLANQLQQLQRKIRRLRDPLRIPERQTFDRAALQRMTAEFIEERGHEPSTGELSDWSGIAPERIALLRQLPRVGSDSQMSGEMIDTPDGDGGAGMGQAQYTADWLDDAMRYVYTDATPLDQKIFEAMTGYLGAELKTPAELADQLGVSQSQISRRFARMMSDLQDIETELGETYGS
jgi:DNA-directed RNA polymerase specialized sigma subunit